MTLSAITIHRFLLRAALAAGNVFAWVLVFHALYFSGETLTGALIATVLAYAAAQLIAFFLTPLSGMNLANGTQRSILYATFALSVSFVWLAAASTGVFGAGAENIWVGIVGFACLQGVYRAFYWIPYRASQGARHQQQTNYLFEVFLTLMPLSASIIIVGAVGGAWMLLVGCATLAFASSIALIGIRESYEPYLWNYEDTMRALVSEDSRDMLTKSMLQGLQGAALLFAWPIAVFILFDWSYMLLGAVMSLTLILTLVGKRLLRGTLSIMGLQYSAPIHSTLAASSWVMRLLIFSPVSVVLADVVYHMGEPTRHIGLDQSAYEQAADSAHYIDHTTALKEMGYALGRLLLCGALILLALYASAIVALAGAIALSAVASLVSIFRHSPAKALAI
ncbi:hypothetical protein HY969_02255 [Candidatus Kaiserbacteria bacterium]|nr:hypothetical protein [Candidatus Kaiserbacteria bacterium]